MNKYKANGRSHIVSVAASKEPVVQGLLARCIILHREDADADPIPLAQNAFWVHELLAVNLCDCPTQPTSHVLFCPGLHHLKSGCASFLTPTRCQPDLHCTTLGREIQCMLALKPQWHDNL